MPTVQKFDRNMIERVLKARGWKYLRDSDGDYRVDFAYDEDIGCSLTLWLIAAGKQDEIYKVLVLSDKRIPRSEWGRAVMLCNTWNDDYRWPKACLYVGDPDTDTTGTITLTRSIDFEKGVHQELLNEFTNAAFRGAVMFWQKAHKEHGL